MQELKGGVRAKAVKEAVGAEAARLATRGIRPKLAAVLATDDGSALSYLASKQKVAASLGIDLVACDLGAGISQEALETALQELSSDDGVHGILIEFPLAPGLDGGRALNLVAQKKDVDGLSPANIGLIAVGRESEAILPATPQACIELAEEAGSLSGKRVGLVGRGQTVGRPLLSMLVNRNATVTVCHTKTADLPGALAECDIVMVAAGRAGLITDLHLKPHHVVIDAGINVVGEKVVGDVDGASVREKVRALTPVPGGVGPLTSAIVFRNLLQALRLQRPELFD